MTTHVLHGARVLGAAAIAACLAAGGANAATLSLGGNAGTTVLLPGTFDVAATGLTTGVTSITYFSSSNVNGGLYVSPNDVNITFEYMGKEAGFTNQSRFIVGDTLMFDTTLTPVQTTGAIPYSFGSSSNPVPFLFRTNNGTVGTGDDKNANNGGSVTSPLRIAFAKYTDQIWYALFDDGGGGQDHDYDDMVLRITVSDVPGGPGTTPLPGALWLLGTVLAGGAGVSRWRKRKAKRAALVPAAA